MVCVLVCISLRVLDTKRVERAKYSHKWNECESCTSTSFFNTLEHVRSRLQTILRVVYWVWTLCGPDYRATTWTKTDGHKMLTNKILIKIEININKTLKKVKVLSLHVQRQLDCWSCFFCLFSLWVWSSVSDPDCFIFYMLVISHATEIPLKKSRVEDTFWSFCAPGVSDIVSSSLWSSCGTAICTSGFTMLDSLKNKQR